MKICKPIRLDEIEIGDKVLHGYYVEADLTAEDYELILWDEMRNRLGIKWANDPLLIDATIAATDAFKDYITRVQTGDIKKHLERITATHRTPIRGWMREHSLTPRVTMALKRFVLGGLKYMEEINGSHWVEMDQVGAQSYHEFRDEVAKDPALMSRMVLPEKYENIYKPTTTR